MNKTRGQWLDNYREWDTLTPWDTQQEQASIGQIYRHRRFVSISNPQRYTSSIETQRQRSHISLSKKYPILKPMSQNQEHQEVTRYESSSHNRDSKCSQPTMRSGWLLRQLKIKHFMMSGKENKTRVPLVGGAGVKKESTYILKQKYANLRRSSRASSVRQEMGLSMLRVNR